MNLKEVCNDIKISFPKFRGFRNSHGTEFTIPSYYQDLFDSNLPILGFGFYGNFELCQVELHKDGKFFIICSDNTLLRGTYCTA